MVRTCWIDFFFYVILFLVMFKASINHNDLIY